MAVVAFGLMAGVLPGGSFVVAIPALLNTFHATQGEGQLVMTIFMVTNTIAMLPTPWLIQRFGMRNCFLWSMVLLVATSIFGALSPSFSILVLARALQGAVTGTLMPMSSIVVMRLFEPKDRGRAAGLMGLAVTLAPAIAPTIGGLMVDHWGWRSVSLMPLPLCVFAWIAAMRYLPVVGETEKHSFDVVGMVLLSLLTLAWLSTASNFAAKGGPHFWFFVSLLILLLVVVAFLRHARRHANPLISLAVLRKRRVAMGAIVSFVQGFGMYGLAYLVPVYFQVALGLSATRAGAALMPGTLALALSLPVAGFLLDLYSPRQVIGAGLVIFSLSWLALGSYGQHFSYAVFVLVLVLSRIGLGFVNAPLNPATLHGLQGIALSQASTLVGYVLQLGGVFGIAVLAGFIGWRTTQGGALTQVQAYGEAFLLVALISAASIAAVWFLNDASSEKSPTL